MASRGKRVDRKRAVTVGKKIRESQERKGEKQKKRLGEIYWGEEIAPDMPEEDFEDLELDEEDKGAYDFPLDEHHPLWVYEPQDLEDMTMEEVKEIWESRELLCGSREAAAEALALLEVIQDIVSEYQGWQAYINRDEVLSFPILGEESVVAAALEKSPDSVVYMVEQGVEESGFSREEVLYLKYEELKEAWNARPGSFRTIEAACQALALLRKEAGITSTSAWQGLMGHVEIQKLIDELPEEGDVAFEVASMEEGSVNKAAGEMVQFEALYKDQRTRKERVSVVREGQQTFRQDVINNYGATCCITGCREEAVLEAAHVIPYVGAQSNHTANGLCLRVDIHRLFDRYLISIDPISRSVHVGKSVKELNYTSLQGVKISEGIVKASPELLAYHFRTFKKKFG